jgi:hypothetical protein
VVRDGCIFIDFLIVPKKNSSLKKLHHKFTKMSKAILLIYIGIRSNSPQCSQGKTKKDRCEGTLRSDILLLEDQKILRQANGKWRKGF